MILCISRLPLLLLTALGMFAVLAGVRWMLLPSERGAANPNDVYQDLADALEDAGVLPFGEEMEMKAALDGLAGQAVEFATARTRGGYMYELELKPQLWHEIKPGGVRVALRAVSMISLDRQARAAPARGGPADASIPYFSYLASTSLENYRITPFFERNKCSLLLIERQ
ncbi:hypothetical protein IIA79_00880 [bacterium]|nr:hypothetical protein [bacterium]